MKNKTQAKPIINRVNALIGPNNECPICAKCFCDQSTALRHLKHVHAPPIKCDYCLKSIKVGGRPDVLRNHLLRCPQFVKKFPNDSYEQAKTQAKSIYGRIKKNRDKAFQPQSLAHSDSGYLELPAEFIVIEGTYQYSAELDLSLDSDSFPTQLFPPACESQADYDVYQ
eukprot:NODE_3_length_80033_cov_0.932970.p54 type:complete len:169 gc:universal NODE_3_length_80033_cov_0.932970:68655-69161(+)